MKNAPFNDVYKKFGILDTTKDFLGHAVALNYSDTYLLEPALETIMKM